MPEVIATKDKPFDTVGFLVDFEDGQLELSTITDGFQHLIDSRVVWQLQGSYGRMAADLIRQGHCVDTHNFLTIE